MTRPKTRRRKIDFDIACLLSMDVAEEDAANRHEGFARVGTGWARRARGGGTQVTFKWRRRRQFCVEERSMTLTFGGAEYQSCLSISR